MQENQPHPTPGLISRSIMALAPIIRIFQGIGLASIWDKIAIALVSLYQRYLSPYKGFRCAHKTLYGGTSCSQYFQMVVREKGLVAAIPKFQQRLLDCKQANVLIHAQDNSEEKTKKKKKDRFFDCNCCYFPTGGDSSGEGGFCDTPDCGFDFGNCDMPDCNCDMPDCNCDIPDCSCG